MLVEGGMKRIIAMVAVFAIGSLTAGYVALAPNASPGAGGILAMLDDAATRLIAIWGRVVAVRGLLGLGMVLALLVAFIPGKRNSAGPKPPRKLRKQPERKEEPSEPAWHAEPLPGDRISSLRRRALGDDPPAPAMSLPNPVALVRKARERDRDWFHDRSWLGGLPRLGEAEWPRDAAGAPLPFAGQIDLGELGSACPENPLPGTGALAFFLGTGAVVMVPAGTSDFSEPPPGLPPACDEGGCPFPAEANRLSRRFFPFWPVDLVPLDLPEDLRDHREGSRGEAIEAAMADLLSRHAAPRSLAFVANDDMLWWHGVSHLAGQLHEALKSSARLVTLIEDRARRAEEMLDLIGGEGNGDDPAVASTREGLAREQATLAAIEAQRTGLPDVIAALDQFTAERDPWQALTVEEASVVEDLLAELHASYGEIVRDHVPRTPGELATLSMRAMITGTPDALAALPEDALARINRDCRLPVTHRHQMFGLAARQHSAPDAHRGDILLLQLAYDDMMEWRWSDMGLFQFWISPEDAAIGNWDAVRLTFAAA